MPRPTSRAWIFGVCLAWLLAVVFSVTRTTYGKQTKKEKHAANQDIVANATDKIPRGRDAFRFETFGDQAFWGDTLKLHQAIEGAALGGVGSRASPKTALTVGLKVDIDALPPNVLEQIKHGTLNLNDPASTLALLQLNAVVGLTGVFNGGQLQSIGIQCALCHSAVDASSPELCLGAISPNPGTGCIGHRLDGWPNHDLNVGAIVALAPDLSAFVTLLSTVQPGITQSDVRTVLNSWGPGTFDAELLLDGKSFNTDQVTDNVRNPNPVPGATLIPPAFGLGGVNLHTWTGWAPCRIGTRLSRTSKCTASAVSGIRA